MAVLPLNVDKIAIDGTEVITSGRVLQNIASASIVGDVAVGGHVVSAALRAGTSSGSDTSSTSLAGGGATSSVRGGLVVAYGLNHATAPGEVRLFGAGPVRIYTNPGGGVVQRLFVTVDGVAIFGSGTNPGAATPGGARFSGAVQMDAGLSLGVQTTIALGGGYHHNVSIGTSNVIAITPTSSPLVSGFADGYDGRIVVLRNTSSTTTFTLTNNDTNSSSPNRFLIANSEDLVIPPYGVVALIYVTNRWLPFTIALP